MNHKAVYRTALATPGLLKILENVYLAKYKSYDCFGAKKGLGTDLVVAKQI